MSSLKLSEGTNTITNEGQLKEPLIQRPKLTKKEVAIKNASNKLSVNPHPLEKAGILSVLFFWWVNPFLWIANRTSLEQKVMPDVPKKDRVEVNEQQIANEFSKNGSIGRTIRSTYLWTFLKCAFLMMITQACYASLALILYFCIKDFASGDFQGDERTKRFGIWFGLIILSQFLGGMLMNYITVDLSRTGIRLKSAVIFAVYKKILRVSVLNPNQHNEGAIVNYVQTDCQKIEEAISKFSLLLESVWQILLGFGVSVYLIHYNIIPLVIVYFLLTFFTLYLYRYIIKYEIQFMVNKDRKVQLLKNVLKNVKYIKQKVWEHYYHAKMYLRREAELGALKGSNFIFSIVFFLNWINPTTALTVAVLSMIIFKSDSFEPAAVLAFMKILVTILRGMTNIPVCIQFFLELRVSLKRLNLFLDADELKAEYIHQTASGESPFSLQLENGSFYWNKLDEKLMAQRKEKARQEKKKIRGKIKKVPAIPSNEALIGENQSEGVSETGSVFSDVTSRNSVVSTSSKRDRKTLNKSLLEKEGESKIAFQLREIEMSLEKGKLTIIFGEIGSGKSSLFYALLGEMAPKFETPKPHLKVQGSISYMSQKPWLMARTIKENIVMDLPFDQEKFDQAIHYAAMEDDLNLFPERENRVLADNGDNVSGGQKTRIELARMIYQK